MRKCRAIIKFGDDFGDNSSTFHCRLRYGHDGPHEEIGDMGYGIVKHPYTLTWKGTNHDLEKIYFKRDFKGHHTRRKKCPKCYVGVRRYPKKCKCGGYVHAVLGEDEVKIAQEVLRNSKKSTSLTGKGFREMVEIVLRRRCDNCGWNYSLPNE